MLRFALSVALVLSFSLPALAASVVLDPSSDPDDSLKAVKSSVRTEQGKGPGGTRAFAWTGVGWNSRLEFARAGSASFAGADRIRLLMHPGTMSGKIVHVIATDDLEKRYDAFSFPVTLVWDGWNSVEIPLLRFVRSGQALWQNMTTLCLEYQDPGSAGELMISSAVLLSSADEAQPVPGTDPQRAARDPLTLASFEDGYKSLNAWDSRDSRAELSTDVYKNGRASVKWSEIKRGSALEYLEGPVSLEGFDTLRVWIRAEQQVSALHVAFGNDARRFAHALVPRLSRGWNDVAIPFSAFTGADSVRLESIEHLVFLYEGADSIALHIDDLVFYRVGASVRPPNQDDPGPRPGPGPKPAPGVVRDASGNVIIRGRGASSAPSASDSRTGTASEPWYSRNGNAALKWYEMGESAELGFSNLPEDLSGLRSLAAWVYSDSPDGELEVALSGHKGEGVSKLEIDWIGWKRVEIPLDSFRGLASAGKIEHLAFRFGASRAAAREFHFDEIALMAK